MRRYALRRPAFAVASAAQYLALHMASLAAPLGLSALSAPAALLIYHAAMHRERGAFECGTGTLQQYQTCATLMCADAKAQACSRSGAQRQAAVSGKEGGWAALPAAGPPWP